MWASTCTVPVRLAVMQVWSLLWQSRMILRLGRRKLQLQLRLRLRLRLQLRQPRILLESNPL